MNARSISLLLLALVALAGCDEVIIGGVGRPSVTPGVDRPDDTEPPVAVCSALPDPAEPFELVDFQGELSYDPDEIPIISWTWDLVTRPEGSNASLPPGEANRPDFEPDLGGTYGVTLVVTNDRGTQSEPCQTLLDVVPEHKLWIEVTWALPDENMDLHLIRSPNGEVVATPAAADDCWAESCLDGMDWGRPNDADDDPWMARSDIAGTGPEAAGILTPSNTDYIVAVVDNRSDRRASDNEVTVRIWIDGVQAWTGTKTFVGEGESKAFAKVSWPSKTISEL